MTHQTAEQVKEDLIEHMGQEVGEVFFFRLEWQKKNIKSRFTNTKRQIKEVITLNYY